MTHEEKRECDKRIFNAMWSGALVGSLLSLFAVLLLAIRWDASANVILIMFIFCCIVRFILVIHDDIVG